MRLRKRSIVYGLRRSAADHDMQVIHASLEEALDFDKISKDLDRAALSPEERRSQFKVITRDSTISFDDLDERNDFDEGSDLETSI
jgi:hypothetical protein